ncbi:MAG: hypothetical protein Q8M34_03005, partial [Thermodesulfovibrionales bacterium]|nr:hypothetical protein [Thermodesulfovibrionales bacterium]
MPTPEDAEFFPSSLLLILLHIVSYIMDFLKEIEEHFDKLSGRQLAAFYTKKIDDFLADIFNSIESQKPIALIATGGYGRAELAPYSD